MIVYFHTAYLVNEHNQSNTDMIEYMKTQNENFLVVLDKKLQDLEDPSVFASFETLSSEIIEVDKIPARKTSEFSKKSSPFSREKRETSCQTSLTGFSQPAQGFK